ncbi:hypothetical protein FY557_04175 [Chryseobacterium sp. SN22]|uniref:energy transducer TonB n=1 Tax=Chryseobacterium sp. SN22 TaxID=2606431 RepID=UPI0011EBA9F4|nr:energy transducer TonB [Chryseobacterium sp. SN22]KAA0129912.1 hypothetical protein FY557_04175 [Chryseobacterium sp. SN22]
MKKLIVIIVLICSAKIFAQENAENKGSLRKELLINEFTKPAEYPGGINAFRNAFAKMFRADKIKSKGVVKSEAQLIISEEGNVTEIKIIGDDPSMNKEMERIMKLLSKTKWTPATINGNPTKFRFRLPITMNLEG